MNSSSRSSDAGSLSLRSDRLQEIYDELRAVARKSLAGWPAERSLQATALVHEAWLRLAKQGSFSGVDRSTFIACAALGIRRILVDHYRAAKAQRRSPDGKRVPLVESVALDEGAPIDLGALDEALNKLHELHPKVAEVVELRFFGGMKEAEAAEALGISLRTASNHWRFARAWLGERLGRE